MLYVLIVITIIVMENSDQTNSDLTNYPYPMTAYVTKANKHIKFC